MEQMEQYAVYKGKRDIPGIRRGETYRLIITVFNGMLYAFVGENTLHPIEIPYKGIEYFVGDWDVLADAFAKEGEPPRAEEPIKAEKPQEEESPKAVEPEENKCASCPWTRFQNEIASPYADALQAVMKGLLSCDPIVESNAIVYLYKVQDALRRMKPTVREAAAERKKTKP